MQGKQRSEEERKGGSEAQGDGGSHARDFFVCEFLIYIDHYYQSNGEPFGKARKAVGGDRECSLSTGHLCCRPDSVGRGRENVSRIAALFVRIVCSTHTPHTGVLNATN